MKHPLIGLYFTIVIGYWLYLIWQYPIYSGSYSLGRALVWPADFLRWLFWSLNWGSCHDNHIERITPEKPLDVDVKSE